MADAEKTYTEAELQYHAMSRALSEEEMKERALKLAPSMRALSEKEMAEHTYKSTGMPMDSDPFSFGYGLNPLGFAIGCDPFISLYGDFIF